MQSVQAQQGVARNSKSWTEISENPIATFYVDIDSIKNNGVHRRAFVLVDLQRMLGDGEQSSFQEWLFNCQDETHSLTYVELYNEPMLNGTLIRGGRFSKEEWSPVSGSAEPILKLVCS